MVAWALVTIPSRIGSDISALPYELDSLGPVAVLYASRSAAALARPHLRFGHGGSLVLCAAFDLSRWASNAVPLLRGDTLQPDARS